MHNFDGLDEINLNKTDDDIQHQKSASPFKEMNKPANLDEENPEKEPALVAPFSSESTLEESVPRTIVDFLDPGQRIRRYRAEDKDYIHKRRQRPAPEGTAEVRSVGTAPVLPHLLYVGKFDQCSERQAQQPIREHIRDDFQLRVSRQHRDRPELEADELQAVA